MDTWPRYDTAWHQCDGMPVLLRNTMKTKEKPPARGQPSDSLGQAGGCLARNVSRMIHERTIAK